MGMGDREFSIPNMVRAFIGDSSEGLFEIYEINCNIDDMTPEDLGPMIDRLLEEGARDATLTPMIMQTGLQAPLPVPSGGQGEAGEAHTCEHLYHRS